MCDCHEQQERNTAGVLAGCSVARNSSIETTPDCLKQQERNTARVIAGCFTPLNSSSGIEELQWNPDSLPETKRLALYFSM